MPKDLGNTLISSEVAEINASIGSQQFTLAAERLIDFIRNYTSLSPEFVALRTAAVKLKGRVDRLQRAVQYNLPQPENVSNIEDALLELMAQAEGAVSAPKWADESNIPVADIEQAVEARKAKVEREERIFTSADGIDALIDLYNARNAQSAAVSLNDVTLTYPGGDFKLGPISLDLEPGKITGIVGMNSSGKSTLLDLVAGILQPSTGSVSYPALEANPVKRRAIASRIGYVKQIPEAWSGILRPNLNYSCAAYGLTGRENEDFVDLFVNRYGLNAFLHKTWRSISGGYKTRFELVRTLVSRPDVLLLDEPLAYLDIVTQHIFLSDLKKIAQSIVKPMPILFTSQHLYEVEAIADNMVILDNGRCLFSGSMEEFRARYKAPLFEVSVEASEREVHEGLVDIGLLRIEPTALGMILIFKEDTQAATVRKILAERFGERLTYFRDVTKSTRRLFRNAREDFENTISIGEAAP